MQTMRAAHWIQLENPVEFNKALREWLDVLTSKQSNINEVLPDAEPTIQAHLVDEL